MARGELIAIKNRTDMVSLCRVLSCDRDREGNPAVGDGMDGPRGHHAKWDKLDRERQILQELIYTWNLKPGKEQAKLQEIVAKWLQGLRDGGNRARWVHG